MEVRISETHRGRYVIDIPTELMTPGVGLTQTGREIYEQCGLLPGVQSLPATMIQRYSFEVTISRIFDQVAVLETILATISNIVGFQVTREAR